MAQDTHLITKILEWPTPANWADFDCSWSLSDKLKWRVALSQKLKSALLARLRDMPDLVLSNELPGTTQAIISAKPSTWAQLLDRDNPLLARENVQVHDNIVVEAAGRGVV